MDTGKTNSEITNGESSVWIGTTNRGFGKPAADELRRLFGAGSVQVQSLSPGDVFRFEIGMTQSQVLDTIRAREPMFLRHMQPVYLSLPLSGTVSDIQAIQEAVGGAKLSCRGRRTAIQARKAEGVELPYPPLEVKRALDETIANAFGAEPAVQEMELIISVYLTADTAYVGWSSPKQNLSSWSGGAIHFRKEDSDISRAKFKLMEAEIAFGLDFNSKRNALDIGAAPGGWSSLLLERGLRVTAVDPAAMHPSVLTRPGFTHLRRNAADVRFRDGMFDLLVCDMSWDPRRMAMLVKELLPSLSAGGIAVTTVKLMNGKPFATIRDVEEIFRPELKLMKAKQLFHNREELTACWIKTDESDSDS